MAGILLARNNSRIIGVVVNDHYALEFMQFLQGQGIRCLEALRDGTPCDAGIVLPVELVERESTRRLPCQTL